MLHIKCYNLNGKSVKALFGGSGRPLVLLHGWSTNPISHYESLELLASRFTVYAPFLYDFRFHNLSEMAEGVAELITLLELQGAIIVGISFGGLLAGIIASSRTLPPKAISTLILVNTAGMPPHATTTEMFLDSAKSFVSLLLKRKAKLVFFRALSGIFFHFSFFRKNFRQMAMDIRQKVNASNIFGNIKVKTTIIWSDNDVTFPLFYASAIHSMIKGSRLKIVKGDHAWHYHSPELFARTISEAAR